MLLMLCGCSAFGGGEVSSAACDLAKISEGIDRTAEPAAALDEGQDITMAEEEIKVVPVRDINTRLDGRNPFLKNINTGQPAEIDSSSIPGEGVLLNFDNADIYEVIQVIAEILDLSYIIDPQVKGVVNIRSGKKIPMAQLFSVFKKLLNINGLDIRSEGDYNYIFKVKNPGVQTIYNPEMASKLQDSPRFVIQIIPVSHLPVDEATKLLTPYLSEQGTIQNLKNPNTLFISDYESKVVDVLMILAKLDISPLSSLKVRLARVDKAPLFDIRDELTEILSALLVNKQGYDGVTVIALERVNSLLLISGNQELLDSATRWVTELDVVPSEGRDNIYIYNVRNSVASDLAALVTDLISDQPGASSVRKATSATASKGSGDKPGASGPNVAPAPAVRKTGGSASKKSAEAPGLRFAGEPTLIADDSRNIILLRTLPADYSRLVKLLERLDNVPRQVLIEVMVAEIKLSDTWEMGIEWQFKESGRLKTGNSEYTNSYGLDLPLAATGFTYSVLNSAGEAVGMLNAIADDNDVSILSSPQVMVLNNETATVNVGEQVPIITSQTGDINSSNLNQTIQYKDTGVILKVTPKINYDGIIILDINQQVSSAGTNTLSGTESPVISNRELNTKLAVRDGQTIFMGGLIENNVTINDSGVPILKDIPLLGWLFKYQSEAKEKTELLVMITPYVIETEDVLAQYTKSFEAQMNDLRNKLNAGRDKPAQ